MRKGAEITTVWTLTVELSPMIIGTCMADLRKKVQVAAEFDQIRPFLWRTQGAVLTVRSEGVPGPLMELAAWALTYTVPEPKRIELIQQRMAPLVRLGDWQGHGRD